MVLGLLLFLFLLISFVLVLGSAFVFVLLLLVVVIMLLLVWVLGYGGMICAMFFVLGVACVVFCCYAMLGAGI